MRSRGPIHVFDRVFLEQKLDNWQGYVLFLLLAVGMSYVMAYQLLLGMGLTAFLVGMTVVLICLLNTEVGLYINMGFSFFVCNFNRLFFHDSVEVGVFSDALILLTLFSLVLKRTNFKQSINHFVQSSPAVGVLLLIYCYMAVELFNPNAFSFNGWFQAFRKILGTLFLLFISFNLFDSYARIRRYLIVLIGMSVIVGIYGIVQQIHGFFGFEMDWVMSDPHTYGLMFIDGEFRKMSTMSDPPSFAIVMASVSVFCIGMLNDKMSIRRKLVLLACIVIMVVGCSFSGIRTANAMIVGGLVLFILMTLNLKSSRFLAVGAGLIFVALMYGPFYSEPVMHFRSTFSGSKDESFNVRETNRKFIQPYIYRHPIGGGLGTTGGAGKHYNPGHYLAGFPPDSGYLKKALEIGWIGYTMIMILYYLILREGIKGYFLCKDPHIRLLYAGVTATMFAFYISDFAQEALGQITDIMIYYPFVAILLRLKEFDTPKKTAIA
jgi:O-antigen ligase/polysaccharide polymerase Wzy-like membrane protein